MMEINASKKLDVKEYIWKLLEDVDCRGIHQVGEQNINCQCPFHRPAKNTTAFGISYENEEWGYPFRCYSCRVTGTIISLISFLKNCNYKRAEKIFYKKIIISPTDTNTLRKKLSNIKFSFTKIDHKLKIELPKKGHEKYVYKYLRSRNRWEHHGLLKKRELIDVYGLYYCAKGFYSHRIIMPVRDVNGEVIYLTNRATRDEVKKTLHPKGFSNDDYIYGLFESNPFRNSKVIIVEGPFDVFQLYSGKLDWNKTGFGIVAIFGTNLNEERASIISDHFDKAYLLFDEDEAGRENHDRAISILRDYMQTISMQGILNKGKDPATANSSQMYKLFDFMTKN